MVNHLREMGVIGNISDVLRVSKSTVLNTKTREIFKRVSRLKVGVWGKFGTNTGCCYAAVPRLSTSICLGDLNPHFNKVKLLYNK